MNVLLDATVFEIPCGGIARATIGLYEAARGLDPSISIVALHRKPLATALPPGWRTLRGATALPLRVWRAVAFPLYARATGADIVHFPWNGNVPRMRTRATPIMTLHDVLPLEIPGYFADAAARDAYRAQKARDLRRARLCITDSDYSRARIRSEFPGSDPVTIRLSTGLPRPAEHPLHTGPYFLYAGGYDPRKGLVGLLRVFLRLHEEGRIRAPLVLTGHRSYFSSEFRDAVERGVSTGRILEAGHVSDADLSTWMRHALALLYPSRYEGFGLPPLEAMSLGCPVVTTRHTSLPEVCGNAAVYAEPDDDATWADAILRLEQDPQHRDALRAAGLAQAATFSWEDAARRFLSEIDRIRTQR